MDQADAVPVSGLALGAPSGGAIGLRNLTSGGRLAGTRGGLLNVIASPPSRRCFRQCRRRTETELALDAFAVRLDRLDAHAQLAGNLLSMPDALEYLVLAIRQAQHGQLHRIS